MLGVSGYGVGVRACVFVCGVIIVKVPLARPHGGNGFIVAIRIEWSHSAIHCARIEIRQTVPIPIAHQVAGGRPHTRVIPAIIRHVEDVDVGGGSRAVGWHKESQH